MPRYIYNNRGKKSVVDVRFTINTDINSDYTALTEEQNAYIESHPDASVSDILNIGRDVEQNENVDVLGSIDRVSAMTRIGDKKNELLNIVDELTLARAHSILLINDENENTPYTIPQAKEMCLVFLQSTSDAESIFDDFRSEIECAETQDRIDNIENDYTILFDTKINEYRSRLENF